VGVATALTGILAIGPGSVHDDAERAVVTSVVALAGLAGVAALSGGAGLGENSTAQQSAAETAARLVALRSAMQTALAASEPPRDPSPETALPDPDDPHALVQPLLDHDAAQSDQLVETLGTWLRCDAVSEAAALRLGIHRHTVRARLRRAAELLDRDLDAFSARAEVWNALQALGRV
jgi:purine catabolism regulator